MSDNGPGIPRALLERADAIDRLLAGVPEDLHDAIDTRTRAALTGYARGLRDAVRELGGE